jgi:glycosyltransferase involved in cell wall biosynthesis
MVAALRNRGWSVEVRTLSDSFPFPSIEALGHAAATLASIPDGALVAIDGLAFGAMPLQVETEAARLRMVALVHLPLAAETGLDDATAARLAASERQALRAATLVVVTGTSTIDAVARLDVPRDRIVVVEPGTDAAPLAHGLNRVPLQLFCAAAVIPRKGHEVLLRALAITGRRDWHLTCAGSLDRHDATVRALRAQVRELELERHVTFVGELARSGMDARYERSDVFVLATLHETYCMAVAEALAHGLPVVSTATGAIPDLVRASDDEPAGLLAKPGDADGFAQAVSSVLGDPDLRFRLTTNARRVREHLPTWDAAAETMIAALERVMSDAHA